LKQNWKKMKPFFKILGYLLILISNLLEIFAVWLLLTTPSSNVPWTAAIIHILAAVTLTIALSLFRLKIYDSSYANPMMTPAFCMALFMPVFGTFTVSLLSLLFKPVSEKETEIFADYLDYVKSIDADIQHFDRQSEDRLILRFLRIEPVVDLLKSKSKAMVWGSIDNLSRRADQTAVNLIRDSIRQEDAEIKFLASIGLEKMEEQLIQKIADAQIEMQTKDDLSAHREYIAAVLSYLTSEISPPELNTGLIEEALRAIREAESRFAATELQFYHARIHALAGNHVASNKIVNDLLQNEKLDAAMLPFAIDSFFRTGQLTIVKTLINRFVNCPDACEILEQQLFEIDPVELQEFWGLALEDNNS